ncbi:MAG TPA: ABC transporter permease [Vicinamibacterales bacterium]|nr:ABC transporter permease [Vicinamibacterales bacterium]
MLQDLRYAARGLAASPGFALAAIASMAIGIGANTAVFSVVDALLLHPLPYRHAERLVILWNRSPGLNIAEDWFSTAQYFDIRNGHGGFEELAIAIGANYNLTDGRGEPERIGVIRVSSNLLPMMGADAAYGRLFAAEDDRPGRSGTAVLAHGTWIRRYGGDPAVVGRTITLNGLGYQIVGVLPASFALPHEVLPTLGVAEEGEIFLPLPLGADAPSIRGHEDYNIIGTLEPGVGVAQAQAEMDAITARLRREHPDVYPPNGGLTFSIVPLLDQVVGGVRRTLVVLAAAVALVLLIACANVANLLLSRAMARQRELAVRTALGATRGRLAAQLLSESLLLAAAGGAAGAAAARGAVAWIHAVRPRDLPRLAEIHVNGEVLLFTMAISAAAGLLFGLAPIAGLSRLDVHGTLKDASRGSSGLTPWSRGGWLRRGLVAGELALSLVLLVGAGLLLRSFTRLQRVPPGFDPRGVLTVELTMSGRRYGDAAAVRNTYRELWERLERLPGVIAAGGITSLPLSGFFAWGPITVEGRAPAPGEQFINADQRVAAGRYFEAMGIPLLRGRFFSENDTPDKPRVIVIDEFMARQLWPGADPIGKRIRLGDQHSTAPWSTVVGVVGRVKQYGLESDGRIALYLPHTQSGSRALYVTVRAAGDPAALAPPVKQAIGAIDPDLPLYHVRTMREWVDRSLAPQRFTATLLAAFSLVALVLAGIGLYGVMAYLVAQGTRDLGIRIALGASERAVVGLVLRHAASMTLAGAAAGLAAAFALTRFMRALLFEVDAADPLTFAAVAAGLAAIAMLASYVPARRAARIDPIESIRAE